MQVESVVHAQLHQAERVKRHPTQEESKNHGRDGSGEAGEAYQVGSAHLDSQQNAADGDSCKRKQKAHSGTQRHHGNVSHRYHVPALFMKVIKTHNLSFVLDDIAEYQSRAA